jgi:hypothetical protein
MSRIVAVLLECLIASLILLGALREVRRRCPQAGLPRVLFVLFSIVGVYGLFAFLAQGIGAMGGAPFLPSSIEWPAAYPDQVLQDPSGNVVVTVVPSGRIQVYDAGGRFVRGWFVQASGGDFTARVTQTGAIEVSVARTGKKFLYSPSGELVGESTSDPTFAQRQPNFQRQGPPYMSVVWPLSHPFAAWTTGVIGMLGAGAVSRLASRRTSG